MPVEEVEGVVLRHYSLGEADRIIVFITRELGKLRATAQGVKRTTSRMAGALELLNHVRLQVYFREGAELARIRQAETVHSYLGKSPSLEKVFVFSYFSELINEFIEEGNPNHSIFRLFLSVLDAAERLAPSEILIRYFEIWLLRLNGVLPNYDYCSSCGRCVKDEEFFAWPSTGQGRCGTCAGGKGIHIRSDAARVLRSMAKLPPERLITSPTPAWVGRELEHLTARLLETHLEKPLKSYKPLIEVLRKEQA